MLKSSGIFQGGKDAQACKLELSTQKVATDWLHTDRLLNEKGDDDMSMEEPRELECPHCGNIQTAVVWDSVNVTLNPELKEKLFQGDINIFTCRKCKETSLINTQLLYHDMTHKFSVAYFPLEALDDISFFSKFTPEGRIPIRGIQQDLVDSNHYLNSPHVVFDMSEMVRYVYFRDKLREAKDTAQQDH